MERHLSTEAPAILRNRILQMLGAARDSILECEEVIHRRAQVEPTKGKRREQRESRKCLACRHAAGEGTPTADILRIDARGDAAEIQRSEQFDFCHVPRRIRQLDAGLPVLCSLKSIGDLSRGAMTPVHPESELDALGLDR